MGFINNILIYIGAVFIVAFFGNIFLILSTPIIPLIKKIKSLTPIIITIIDICSNFFAVFLVVLLCSKLNVKPTLLMIIIPGILTIQNDSLKIKKAKIGISNVEKILERSGEAESYLQELDVRIEYAHLIGDVIGLLLGTIYFLSDKPLF
jgi:hypothetical protein